MKVEEDCTARIDPSARWKERGQLSGIMVMTFVMPAWTAAWAHQVWLAMKGMSLGRVAQTFLKSSVMALSLAWKSMGRDHSLVAFSQMRLNNLERCETREAIEYHLFM